MTAYVYTVTRIYDGNDGYDVNVFGSLAKAVKFARQEAKYLTLWIPEEGEKNWSKLSKDGISWHWCGNEIQVDRQRVRKTCPKFIPPPLPTTRKRDLSKKDKKDKERFESELDEWREEYAKEERRWEKNSQF